jgi:transcriptional regulator GlxA family with amidase domain
MFYFRPMAKRVVLVGYDGAEALDLFGPADVFSEAGERLGAPAYELIFAAAGGGPMALTCGASVAARDLATIRPRAADTVLVAGGADRSVAQAASNPALLRWLRRAAPIVSRIGSVCDGAFVVAAAGILAGRRAATHWSSCERLARLHPEIEVDREAIYVRIGGVWTSAGVTTGIDMALAMVEEDHGRQLADRVAAHLVLYARRLGFQSQFSDALVAQVSASDPLGPLVAWVRENLRGSLDAPRLARKAGHVGALVAASLPAGARHHSREARREAARRAGTDAAVDDAARDEDDRVALRLRFLATNGASVRARARRLTARVSPDVCVGESLSMRDS